ncbi:ABC transporter ATP-binding protein [Georgenia muralis]|uniref:ABC-type quaternary amine transporter n=1 Tax=Georgenia muralis TaxID=154117 RepID=A0A3N4Z0K5_9MICO|nr:ABC transporter ATP-binding protein [Georgenia muralis]RPF26127.1 iron(III) transport system ATP-binding protein [Georgenia muralis]
MKRLQITGLRKSFGSTEVLRGIDLDVPSGALAAVLGPSGCGKTTLLRIIAGFEDADAGQVRIGNRVVATGRQGLPPERRRVAVVPQEGALFPHLTVAANVAFGMPRRQGARRRERVRELLALVGLADLGSRMPAELSGGQQQRVALARALAPDPDVVLLDEPFSALDAGLRASVREDVRDALHSSGATGVLVTHDQEEALSIADVVAVVRAGQVVQAAAPEQLYRAPADLDVATFVGEAVILPADVAGGVATTALGRLPLLRGDQVSDGHGLVAVRPEQVHIVRSGRGGVTAKVLGTTFYGHDASVRLSVCGADGADVPVLCRTQGPLPSEEEVGLVVAGPVSFFAGS